MSAPDMGDMAVLNAMNPPLEPSTSDSTQSSIPMPDDSASPTQQQADQAPQQPQQPAAPAKPSLWRSVLAGALQGMAAGASVNTKGMGGAGAFAAGAGAGANQVLNVVPKQNAELDQAKAQTAFHYVQLAHIQRELNVMPDNKREAYLNDAADTYNSMLKGGAVVPMSQPTDLVGAQTQLQALHSKNPWAVYSVMPVRGDDGTFQYSAVQFTKAPTQEDVTYKGAGADGSDVVVPKGTPADKLGMLYTNQVSKKVEAETKSNLADQNNTARSALADKNNAARSAIADKTIAAGQQKAALAATGTNVVAFDPEYQNPDGSTGANVVLDKGTAQQRGLFNYKADPAKINATVAGFNDVQTKLNQLASVAMDASRMSQVSPQVAADMLRHGHGIELGAFGTKLDTSTIDADLARTDSLMANQATRDYVTAMLGAHEALTQLPRLQTFGQSSRMTQQQMEAAQRLLPQPGEDASLSAQKMTSLQNIIDPLRKQLPIMPGATLVPSWHEQRQKPPAATHVYIPGLGTVAPIQGGN